MTDSQFKNWIISLLRKGTFKFPYRNEAKKKARVPNGTFKNGNTKYGYLCASCKNIFKSSEVDVDHIHAVVGKEGFKDWNTYIERLYPRKAEYYQVLCVNCHDIKSKKEIQERKEYRKKKKST